MLTMPFYSIRQFALTLLGSMEVALLSARWPERTICHHSWGRIGRSDSGAAVNEAPTLEYKHIPTFATEHDALALRLQILQKVVGDVVVALYSVSRSVCEFVAPWPYVERAIAQCNNDLIAAKIMLVPMGRSTL